MKLEYLPKPPSKDAPRLCIKLSPLTIASILANLRLLSLLGIPETSIATSVNPALSNLLSHLSKVKCQFVGSIGITKPVSFPKSVSLNKSSALSVLTLILSSLSPVKVFKAVFNTLIRFLNFYNFIMNVCKRALLVLRIAVENNDIQFNAKSRGASLWILGIWNVG